jgi:tetratricopeptide (TPR) repeat protein
VTLEEQARAALRRGDLTAAGVAAGALISATPDRAAGYFLLGMAAAEARQIAKAVPLLQEAVSRGPEAEHLAQLAKLLILQRRDGEAAVAAEKALALRPDDPLTLDTAGCVLARLGRHEETISTFAAAVAAEPENLDYRYNLAAASGFTGRVNEARAQYEEILTRDPGNARAHYALSILSRQTPERNHIPRLHAALLATDRLDDTLRLRYALAKELEDIGQPAQAYRHLSAANEVQKQRIAYGFAQDAKMFDAIEALFGSNAHSLTARPGHVDASTIFVVGMPRTGTTLVDRILSSHRDVESAGELQAMPLTVKRLSGTSSRTIIDPATITASGDIDPVIIGEAYLTQAAHHRPARAPRFTDKLPANFLYIGHIARALPNAPIVCLRRDAMDTVWSNYKNLFASRSPYYAYSYDLMDTAQYYARFARLMTFWEGLFPGRVLQLSYEELVRDQEGQTRRLLEHCGLEWDKACLSFHENSAAVATPSAAQVRRPLNSDAVGKWRLYEKPLRPVAAWLQAQGIATE